MHGHPGISVMPTVYKALQTMHGRPGLPGPGLSRWNRSNSKAFFPQCPMDMQSSSVASSDSCCNLPISKPSTQLQVVSDISHQVVLAGQTEPN